MKKPSWRKIGVIGLTLAATILFIFYFTKSKSSAPHSDAINPAFGEYVSSYTAGVISSGSKIRITLTSDAVDSSLVGQETSVKLIELRPSVKGITRWLDRKTLEFVPASRLVSGQFYDVRVFLSKLVELPKDLSTFEYSFQVIPQNFELTVENIKPYVATELTRQKIEGTLVTSDYADPTAVEEVLKGSQQGKILNISWTHSAEGKQHFFIVEDVARKDVADKVKLSAHGASLGITQDAERDVEIPSLSDFKVMEVKADQNGGQHIVLQFSDPLNAKQDLQGMISVGDLSDLDFEIKDNQINVYPPVKQTGTLKLTITSGIKNILNYKMKSGGSFDVVFEELKPEVRFIGKGSILPGTQGMVMPFEAVNLKTVDVEIIRIFEPNVLQFLQVNDLDGNTELRRVGKPVLKKSISLENAGITDVGKWNRFTLDLATLINTEPGAIYQVRLSFRKSYLAYACEEDKGAAVNSRAEEDWSDGNNESSNWDSYEENYYGEDYDWEQRDNPCSNSYYSGHKNVKRNVIGSDLGLLAKRGSDGTTTIVVNDLKTTHPVSGVQFELYDFQQRLIGTASSGADGKAAIVSKETPFALIAKNGPQRGYLKLQDGLSLSLSNFDTGGEQVKKGLKGFLYGERGVWRPGDSLYVGFILEDKLKTLPAGYPVVFELQNPQGQVTNRAVKSVAENGFYKFVTFTSPDAPTGNWMVHAKVGGTEFMQPVRIEMVKPNRLKINLDFGVDKLKAGANNIKGSLKVNWLQGTPGKNLKAEFEVLLTRAETKFPKYPGFIFDDPTRTFTSEAQPIFEGYTDQQGNATVNANLKVSEDAPGMLNAVFRGKVFEEGGNFSIDRFSIPFYPYESFTGIRLPEGDKARGMLLTDTAHRVDVVVVDADGNPVSRQNIEMSIYKIQWKWWWDNSGGNTANFMTGQYAQPLKTGKIGVVNGKGVWNFRINSPEWGRYFVKAYDPVSGHSTGKVVYIDWPGWAGRSRAGNEGANMLSFSSDKKIYTTGEKINLVLPGADNGRALISIENGSKVIETFWMETKKGDNAFSFEATKEMTPNIFVYATLLQPHAQTSNDLPIRMYGVIPIQIENPDTHLTPEITMPDVLEPGREVVIKISEQGHKKMTYTLAIVEEGLLDLTRYKTPDPWSRFYARESLGVKTWDLYDDVMGAFGGKLERLLAIGGDGSLAGKEDDAKANRFKPVVKFLGPFTLGSGSNEHRFIMPQYIGSVRTMVVCGSDGAYGFAENTTPVRKPLMVLATLPRVLGPEETLKLPVTIFSMDPAIHNVKVEVKASGPVRFNNGNTQSLVMNGTDLTTQFDLAVAGSTGIAKIEVTVTSGNYKASDIIEIQVRNPNPPVTKIEQAIVETGQTWTANVAPTGKAGTNTAVLEVSSLPPINLSQRLKYLMQYPYGCIEQTTSSVFPQLYLDRVKALSEGEKLAIQNNIKAGVDRLKLFITRDGGFSYWPGGEDSESWGSTYAGHFLVEADGLGYFVPHDMIQRWKKYERSKAQSWRKNQESLSGELIQAYRLYTLALAGEPELGSMNRLREEGKLPVTAAWMLAAAYIKAGQPEAAKSLIADLPTTVQSYQEQAYSFGSDLRDKAIILETLVLLNERSKGFELVKDISAAMSNSSVWMNTQTIAWCLKSVGAFAGTDKKGELKFSYTYKGKQVTAGTQLSVAQVPLEVTGLNHESLQVTSATRGSLFVRLMSEGVPARGQEEDAAESLSLDVTYTNTHGDVVDPSKLEQGTSFIATVVVGNPGIRGSYKNMALTQIFPPGWEINNLRLEDAENRLGGDKATYQDIRDDRVYTYFDLAANQRKTFKVLLTASYAGNYYLPAVSVEAMYDHSIFARKKGKDVSVVSASLNP